MEYFPLLYLFFGLVVGSFLNVCIHRIPLGESVVHPGSRCPRCRTPIRPYDNVPVASYLALRGRCRACSNPISPRYPAVEALTGLGFYGCAVVWGLSAPTFVNSLFVALVIVLVFIDYDHQILPNVITLPGAAAGLALSPLQEPAFLTGTKIHEPWLGACVGALAGALPLWIVARVYVAVRGAQGIGMGDVKMMAMVGAFLGWPLAALTIFAGSLLGSLLGLFVMLFRGGSLQTRLPFGTFLGAGAIVLLFFGIPLVNWYLRVFFAH